MPKLEIHLLGEFLLVFDGAQVPAVNSPRLQSLLAYLLLHREAPQSRQQLAFLFWPDSSETQARANLRFLFHSLRQTLPDPDRFLYADSTTLQWRSDAPFSLDAIQFEDAISHATLLTDWQAAVELYRGDLLPSNYDDWLLSERDRLRQMYLQALEQLSLSLEKRFDYRSAIRYAQLLLRYEPLHEDAYRRLMRLHALNGDRAGVVSVYNTCVTVLDRELGIEPSAETREAYQHLLDFQAAPSLGVNATQAVSLETRRNNLPFHLTSFIGREREKALIKDLLSQSQLLTLTGSGGVGKTRLALAVAIDLLNSFPDGVWWIDLAPLTDPTLLLQKFVSALGLLESPRHSPLDMIVDHCRHKKLLLIIDNCEHMIQAIEPVVKAFLRAGQELRILVTSRESLRIPGEMVWRVPSLSILSSGASVWTDKRSEESLVNSLLESESIRLFVDRATLALPTFKTTRQNASAIAQICRRLDGIPLAIELAAARIKLLSAIQISERLDDSFSLLGSSDRTALPRHQTLRGTMDWSYKLLSEKEQVLLRRLSVFSGGFSLEAAESICTDGPLQRWEILDLVSSLQDKSLVEVEQQGNRVRNHLLETVRQYAREKLVQQDESDRLLDRHLEFFMGVAEHAERELQGTEQLIWLQQLETEHENLRGALAWSMREKDAIADRVVEQGLRLAGALWEFWLVRGHLKEGRQWLSQSVRKSNRGQLEKSRARAKAIVTGVGLAYFQGNWVQEIPLCEEGLAIAQHLGDNWLTAVSLLFLGDYHARYQYDLEGALRLFEQALTLARQLGDNWLTALVLWILGIITRRQGDALRARILLDESLLRGRQVGDPWLIAGVLNALGSHEFLQGDCDRATVFYDESLRLRRSLQDTGGVAGILNDMGQLARCQHNYSRAVELAEESLALFRAYGQKESVALVLRNLAYAVQHQGDWSRAAALFQESASIFLELENLEGLAISLIGFAVLACGRERLELAVQLFGIADVMLQRIGASVPFPDNIEYDQALAHAKSNVDKTKFETEWALAQSMSTKQAIDFAVKSFGNLSAHST